MSSAPTKDKRVECSRAARPHFSGIIVVRRLQHSSALAANIDFEASNDDLGEAPWPRPAIASFDGAIILQIEGSSHRSYRGRQLAKSPKAAHES